MRSRKLRYEASRALRIGVAALGLAAPAYAGDEDDDARGRGLWTDGRGTFAMSGADIVASFDALSPQQQARVMQRCKNVIANPGEADANQVALCQTLKGMAKR